MGILVKHHETDRIIFYLKGADLIMFNKVKEVYKGFLKDESENLACSGFRTLVFAQSLISPQRYKDFQKKLKEAKLKL